jgi:RNA polymerase sigma factor (sigma-70 family)
MTDPANPIHHLLNHLFRHESGKMVAVLVRLLGFEKLDTAQDIVQDTLLQALQNWRFRAIPDNPAAWLHRVARNKAIDYLRRQKKFRTQINPQYQQLLQSEYSLSSSVNELFSAHEINDSQLQMIFACCHPAIPEESQVALTLKTLCGLSTEEIARAFLTGTETISKRIYRAKEKIRQEKIELNVPGGPDLVPRLDMVLKILYLLFNEGYNSSHPDQLIRNELCEESFRLCQLLVEHPHTQLSRTQALMALFCFQSSRLQTRLDANGQIIVLKDQDRSRWNHDLIRRGFHWIDTATDGTEVTTYHLEAGIASLHSAAPSFEQTDWKSIYDLYCILYQLQPGPIVAMNKAIASAYAISREKGLQELMQIRGLENYYLWYATAGELYLDNNNLTKAREAFAKALALTHSQTEKRFLLEKLARCN